MKLKIISLISLLLIFGGCSLSPKYEQPQVSIPSNFTGESADSKISVAWWKDFNDEYLNTLVDEALKNNYDLSLAMSRISQARSQWSYARSDRYPNIGAKGEATRNNGNMSNPVSMGDNYNNFSLSAVLSFELDLWGRARDSDRKAYAMLLSSKASRDTIKLSLISNVIQSYFGILVLNNQVEISRYTLKSRTESYEYRKKEYEIGKIPEIDMQQAKSEMASVKAQMQKLLMEQNAAQTSLMILLGRNPQEIFDLKLPTEAKALPKSPVIPIGLSSTLLEQRPDIEVATQNLKASNFAIGVARSAYFPTISLTGLAGYVSPQLNNLMQSSSSTWNYGGNFVGNLLDMGRTMANVDYAKAQQEEMLLTYGQVVRNAFGEVRDSLFNYSMSGERLKSLDDQVKALRRTLVLAELRYAEGYTNYLEVLNTQSSLFAAELTYQSAALENLSASINVYKAFGGGWDKTKYVQEE
ncbi:efflux transporter outer membrane subunit [Helicobacter ibis]|uniref:TolC family protein n=1 Tax=Helicobacter ibis TaxID=2962633 RepID=A0ABT4VCG0_9HELI|nr:TolC family protein [Helicobacter ibis]MDA3968383.1 TolC family protein [Helicobacter ibis]